MNPTTIAAMRKAQAKARPPEDLTVSQWADRYRKLSPESSAEAGQWRTSRTPYLKEPMDAFTDPAVNKVTMVAASQVGKTEFELNCLAYLMDQDPGTVLFVHPTLDDARKFSRLRIAPMIRDCRRLASKINDVTSGGEKTKSVLNRSFPGGMLILAGSSAPSALASTPARYIFGDERDRWALSAGTEGDPWALAQARQTTFYNAKSIEVSTPTIKGASAIEASFLEGTRERWCVECPHCHEFHDIDFGHIHFNHSHETVKGKKIYHIEGDIEWACPTCGSLTGESEVRRQPRKWVAENPSALKEKGHRSFWLNAWSSPWTPWKKIVLSFLDAKDDPERLQVVYNTLFGELWEDRGGLMEEDELLERREDYGTREDGSPVELPDGVLCLTCGVDVQDNRIEYEVVGHGRWNETWGIERGIIVGEPSEDEVWERLDGVVGKIYRYLDGRGLRISATFIDSGGHYTQEVYIRCRERLNRRVFPIKGRGGEGVPYTSTPRKVDIKSKKEKVWLYIVGVDAGKQHIMSALKVKEPGPNYQHLPKRLEAGYNEEFASGLLSEHLVLSKSKTAAKWQWQKLPGHRRNEALDCRNYAMAALRIVNPDFDKLELQLKNPKEAAKQQQRRQKARHRGRRVIPNKEASGW